MARTTTIAVIGGDGIGPEVIAEAVKVLRAAADDTAFQTTSYDLGAERYLRTGEILPDSVLAELAEHDAVLLGAVGDPKVAGGILRKGTPAEIAMQESINTAFGVGRVTRHAFGCAAARPRRKVTLVHKTNVLAHAGDLWRRTFEATATEFGGVTTDYCHVDAALMYLVTQPGLF